MKDNILEFLKKETEELEATGLFKKERVITSPQQSRILSEGQNVINLCANNYLGLSNHPRLVKKAQEALDQYGFGMSSVRFICGTQDIHKELEEKNLFVFRNGRHHSL